MKSPSSRDALYLMRMLVEECDSLLNFSEFTTALRQDVHHSLRESNEIYNAACSINPIGTINSENSLFSIMRNSISSMLVPISVKSTR